MNNSQRPAGSVQAALHDAVLALGGVMAARKLGDDLAEAMTSALGAVVRRHLSSDAGMSGAMEPVTPLRPHPAVAKLLEQIGPPPETPAAPTTPTFGDDEEWLRMLGLFRRWEIEQILDGEHDLYVEGAGRCDDGTGLFTVYKRVQRPRGSTR